MADWVLEAKVIVKSEEATDNMKKLGDETTDTGVRSMFALDRMKKSLLALSAATGTVFAKMVAWSPTLAAAFSLISLHIGLAALAIGEELAPIIMDTLVPAFRAMSEWIQNLNPLVLQWIGVFIFLTVAIGVVIGIITIFMAIAAIPMIGTILLVIAVIAAIIVIIYNWAKIFDWIEESISRFIIVLGILGVIIFLTFGWPIALAVLAIIAIIEVIRNWGKISKWLTDKWRAFKKWFSNLFSGIGDTLEAVGGKIKDFFSGLMKGIREGFNNVVDGITDIFSNMVDGIKDGISGLFSFLKDTFDKLISGEATESFVNAVSVVIKAMINTLADYINTLIEKIQGAFDTIRTYVNKIPYVDWGGVVLPTIPSLHEGGVYDSASEGTILVKRGERVLTPTQNLEYERGGGGARGTVINHTYYITISGGNFSSTQSRETEIQSFMEGIKREQQRYGYT